MATLLSGAIDRSVLSATVMFLAAGFVSAALGWASPGPRSPVVLVIAEFALVTVLFTDGMKVSLAQLARERRGLLVLATGTPATILLATLAARLVVADSWLQAALLASILSPTDPVLAAAIVGRSTVPARLRSLLNVESGLNDGLALPAVVVLLELGGPGPAEPLRLVIEILAGIAIGVAIPFAYFQVERFGVFGIGKRKGTLAVVAVALAVFVSSFRAGANVFLATFFAGVALRTWASQLYARAEQVGEVLSDFAKLAAVYVFASAVSLSVVRGLDLGDLLFVALLIIAVRPLALAPLFPVLGLTRPEWAVAAWFGPRGFSSVVYSILLLASPVQDARHLFHVAALTIVVSIVLHSSTDTLAARWLQKRTTHEP